MHLDAETLERALHDELDPESRETIERHVAACPSCRERLSAARRDERRLFDLLEELDHEPPALDWEAITRVPDRDGRAKPRGHPPARSLIAASVAFLVLAAGILAAIPGSPVREVVESLLGGDEREAAPVGARPTVSGIALDPADPFEVRFAASQARGRIRIHIVPASRLELRVVGEPVLLESGVDRILVSNAGSGSSYELRVPSSLVSIRVGVQGATVFEKQGNRILTEAVPDSDGIYTIEMTEAET